MHTSFDSFSSSLCMNYFLQSICQMFEMLLVCILDLFAVYVRYFHQRNHQKLSINLILHPSNRNDFLLKVSLVRIERHQKKIFRYFHRHHLNKKKTADFCLLFFLIVVMLMYVKYCILSDNFFFVCCEFSFLLMYLAFALSLVIIQQWQRPIKLIQENFHLLPMFSDKISPNKNTFSICLYFC